MHRLIIHSNEKTIETTVPENITLLEALRLNGYPPESPCNGKGTCGKCRVRIHNGTSSHTKEEKKLLSENDMKNGIHLACRTHINKDMEVTLLHTASGASILTTATVTEIDGEPILTKKFVTLSAPTVDDQMPDDQRLILSATDTENNTNLTIEPLSLPVLQNLPDTIRQDQYQVTIIKTMGKITGVESGNTTNRLYGVAVDIGTTTLAAYLYDLDSKKQMAVASSLNPQRKFGADVISRIDHSINNQKNRNEMATLIRNSLNDLINELSLSSSIKPSDIYLVALAGNTTMIHLLLNIDAKNIALAPFIPATLSGLVLSPWELSLSINPYGGIMVLPSVSAYVGADITAAVLSTGMQDEEEITLLVDIGTNGEIVLGNNSSLYACSTAAGPAFEGANIACGIGGVEGAISEVLIAENEEFEIHTIGKQKAVGICGSGLIDAISCMLDMGIIDETGRIVSDEEAPETISRFRDRFTEINGQPAFVITPEKETGIGNPIVVTQKDIREVQNAKAAIAAGIRVLIRESGMNINHIRNVYLAGGFGSHIRISSALRIGLLPNELTGRITAVGNAAGAGAIHTLLSGKAYNTANKIAKKVQYLELSSNVHFVNEYTENMIFDV